MKPLLILVRGVMFILVESSSVLDLGVRFSLRDEVGAKFSLLGLSVKLTRDR